ncbi:hypothetical protein NP233_g6977 [Leucocoprinus birnbaumii]|uniref:Fungal-type protein kinase domain-containing protein n=1 Tax=Leucocoprinus birnbaumii TaxID=56174 RepID=A0AAD5VST9_9AGAR|nr:hypothetical protein NP233_g6977 [Leucocoprinus birnbaumii]
MSVPPQDNFVPPHFVHYPTGGTVHPVARKRAYISDQDGRAYRTRGQLQPKSKAEEGEQTQPEDIPAENSRPSSPTPTKRTREPREALLYEPLVKILNRIAQTSTKLRKDQDEVLPRAEWVNTHKKAPKTRNTDGNILLPNVSLTYTENATQMRTWGPRVESAKSCTSTQSLSFNLALTQYLTYEHQQPDTFLNESTEELDSVTKTVQSRLWLQIYTVVEVKAQKATDVLAQLATYVRQIFMEQLDRLYVFASTFELDTLRVHLFDRSGIISSTPINIHQSPIQFISAIASWSYFSPKELGWDPTVHVWSDGKAVSSYKTSMKTFTCAYDVPWVIESFDGMSSKSDGAADCEVPHDTHIVMTSEASRAPFIGGDASVESDPPRDLDSVGGAPSESTAGPPMTVDYLEAGNAYEDDDEMIGDGKGANEPTHHCSTSGKRHWVAIRSLTIRDAKRLWGRGTIVLEVVSLEDWKGKNEQAEIYVMKQSWQRLPGLDGSSMGLVNSSNTATSRPSATEGLNEELESQPFEAFVLHRAGLHSRIEAAGFVRVDSRKVDTSTYIRKDVRAELSSPLMKPTKSSSGSRSQSTTQSRLSGLWDKVRVASKQSSQQEFQEAHLAFVNRILVRMVLRLPGVTVQDFVDKTELLEGFRGAIKDHEVCYRNGIIQRDVSLNNIIISNGRGHLIDFDHSKFTRQFKPLNTGTARRIRDEERILQSFEESVVRSAEMCDLNPEIYLLSAKDGVESVIGPRDTQQRLSLEDFGWPREPYEIPVFEARHAGPGYVTGTPPYLSSWLATSTFVAHTAIHDAESFVWSFAYAILKYSGPGAAPRQTTPELDAVLDLYFFHRRSIKAKWDVLQNKQLLETLLNHVSPYFEDLKDLLRDWHRVLTLARTFPTGMEHNYPHQAFLSCIERAIKRTGADNFSDSEQSAKNARKEHIEDIKRAIREQQTTHAFTHSISDTATSSTAPVQAQDAPSSDPVTHVLDTSDSTADEQSPPRKIRKKLKEASQ